MEVASSDGTHEFVAYSDIHALQITGSTSTAGGGVIGGGFGVAGAAEGMLAASVLNALTKSTTIYSVVRVAARAAEYVFVSHKIESSVLSMMLTPVQFRIRQAQLPDRAATLPVSSSIADELTKLANLREQGILSDSEFVAAKARLLT